MMKPRPKVAIIYASGSGRTKLMAEAIAEGARTVKGLDILFKDVRYASPVDVSDADAILLGGSTRDGDLIPEMKAFIDGLQGLDLRGKVGIAFGSYGWSGEGVPIMMERMKSLGMKVTPGWSVREDPSGEVIKQFFMLGKTVAGDLVGGVVGDVAEDAAEDVAEGAEK